MEEPLPSASLRRKNKGKAPRPPADTRSMESASTLEFEATIMEQKENLDRDVHLTVVLPDEVTASTSVNGSKPMMDLLIFLCARYRLNPSSYTMELVSEGPGPVKFKPNTPIGMLEVDKVILKPKNLDEKHKKPVPVVPEQTVRVVINYKKTQKAVVRASPHVSLQELLPTIASKCEQDPLHTVLLKDLQSQEPLEMSKSLNDLGLRELYAADTSRAASVSEFPLSSSQESFQIPDNIEMQKPKDDEKGFFRFLRRSKKKREQASSAPATPLFADQRPVTVTRPSKVFKQYESNTLPSEMPKKRRAPLPPMYASQTVPKDFAQGGPRPQSCVVKSVSVDGEQDISGKGVVRTGSLQLSGSSSNESTLRRGKRKAPPPPSPTSPPAQDQTDENGNDTASPTRSTSEDEHNDPPSATGGAVFDYSLEGIEEKEECSSFLKETSEPAPVTEETCIPAPSVDVPTSTEKELVVSTSPGISSGGSKHTKEQSPKALRTEARVTTRTAVGTNTGDLSLEKNKELKTLDLHSHGDKLEIKNSINDPAVHKSQAGTLEFNSVRDAEAVQSTDGNICENGEHKSNSPHMTNGSSHFNSTSKTVVELVMVKKHDAAIQTASLQNDHDFKMDAEDLGFGDVKEINNPHWTVPSRLPLQSPSQLHQRGHSVFSSIYRNRETAITKENLSPNMNDEFFPTEKANQGSVHSPSKGYALYRQLSEPKPKPSNEVTRDYIPKVGMTTYKIVPPSSLEKLRFLEPEKWMDVKDIDHNTQTQQGELYRSQTEQNSSSFGTTKDYQDYCGYTIDARVVSPSAHSTSTSQAGTNTITSHRPPSVMPKPDKTRISPEKRENQNDMFPKARTNSFYSQLQRRVTGQYVTSAAAKSSIGPISPTTQTSPTTITSPNIPTSPTAPTSSSPSIPSSPAALTSSTTHAPFPSHTSPSNPAALTSSTTHAPFPSHTIPSNPAALTSSTTHAPFPSHIIPSSPTALTSSTSHAPFPSHAIPSNPAALTSSTTHAPFPSHTIPSSPTALTSSTSHAPFPSHTISSSPTALTSLANHTRPTTFTSHTIPTSPVALTSTSKSTNPTSPAALSSPTALTGPTAFTSHTVPFPAEPVHLVTENNVPSLSPENTVHSTNSIQSSSELIQTKNISNLYDGKSEKLTMKPPLIAPKPFSARSKSSGLLQLRSFAAPRSCSSAAAPSPFALAVSSAVKRSQSFSKTHSAASHPLRKGSLCARSPPMSPDNDDYASPESCLRRSSDCALEQKMNLTNSEKSSTIECPPLVLDKTLPVSSCPSSDPEQIRQSLLDAIRSGEAAANLKRVTVRSNTISINGRSGWSRAVSTDVP